MDLNMKTSIFQELQRIYWESLEPISEKEIVVVLNRINQVLTDWWMSVKDIIPEWFYKQEWWKTWLVHEVFSEEYYEKFAEFLIQIREKLGVTRLAVLEVWAWNGIFTKQLRTKLPENISITATDISPVNTNVIESSYEDAIKDFQPHVVIACWPLIIANTDGESLFIRTLIESKSVKWCFLIWVPSRCEFDEHWFTEYQEESWSTFTNIVDIPELSRLQIWISRLQDIPVKNWVNPLVLWDQWIDDSFTSFLGDTFKTSRTSYISRWNPKW
jgi:hypothetical protein